MTAVVTLAFSLRRLPGDTKKSYLYNKAAGGPVGEKSPGVASDPMPPTGPLGATDLAMLKKWIETGAPK